MSNATLTGQNIGDYVVGALLGSGGMSDVYQGYHKDDLNKRVAIKVLQTQFLQEADLHKRFIREIRMLEVLEHENVMPIYSSGQQAGMLYIVMKLIKGASLDILLKRHKFSPAATWKIILQVAEALDFGHSKNILHRDVKPANVFVEGEQVYLGDFGLGKHKGVDETFTEDGTALGTPAYMSPEAVLGEAVTSAADVYSLAVVTYQMVLGILPFDKKSYQLTAIAHVQEPVPAPTALQADFPITLENVILKGLAKQTKTRYATVREFATDYYTALMSLSKAQRNTEYWVD